MNEMPSSRFRVAFHKLGEPTVVTANGHRIGTWYPGGSDAGLVVRAGEVVHDMLVPDLRERDEEIARLKRELAARPPITAGEANARARLGLKGPLTATHIGYPDGAVDKIEPDGSFSEYRPAPKPVGKKR